MDAEKLRKKLNGATLKGTKVRIEKARPEVREQPDDDSPNPEKSKKKKSKSKKAPKDDSEDDEPKKKRKREHDVFDGVKLEDRKVKRGWTETPEEAQKKPKRSKESKDKDKKTDKDAKQKKKRVRSKYTEGAECLLNTKVPPNALKNLTPSESSSKRRKKDKSRQVTIHEFEKTTKFPSFLKTTSSAEAGSAATEYVEGKGWVDEEGNVVEAVAVKEKPDATKRKSASKKKSPEPADDSDDSTSSSGTSSEEVSSESDSSEDEAAAVPKSPTPVQQTTPDLETADKARPMSSSSSRSLSIKIPPPITPSSTKVHPLEALYKRAKPDETVTATPAQAEPFSFFGGGDIEEDDEPSSQTAMPMTPYTRQDFEWRNVRSAAPTPDTAHPSRMRNFWANGEQDADADAMDVEVNGDADDNAAQDEEEEEEEQAQEAIPAASARKSEFQDWFWENRRDLNRSWMKRRKAAAKEKRHRENKARASRVF
ncbi:hypothetical protein LIA77_09084 [Sarocladium implicatum]|nr:hypothetical protein LIA77_09084 [Sarocladium implicatum]